MVLITLATVRSSYVAGRPRPGASSSRPAIQELFDAARLVGGEVVEDDVDVAAFGVRCGEAGKEGDELLAGVSRCGPAEDLTGRGVERCIERQGAVAHVLEAVSFRASWGERQDRVAPIERLDGRLFIETEYDRVLRGIEVQPDNIQRLGLEIRIGGGQVALHAVRLQPRSRPGSSHPHVRDPQVLSQLARAPLGAAVRGRFAGDGEDARLQPLRRCRRPAALVPAVQPRQPLAEEATLPEADVDRTAAQPILDRRVGRPLGEQQHQLGSLTVRTAQPARPRAADQLGAFDLGQDHGVGGFEHALMIAGTLIK